MFPQRAQSFGNSRSGRFGSVPSGCSKRLYPVNPANPAIVLPVFACPPLCFSGFGARTIPRVRRWHSSGQALPLGMASAPCLRPIEKRRRLDAQAPQVDVSLPAMVDLVVDHVEQEIAVTPVNIPNAVIVS